MCASVTPARPRPCMPLHLEVLTREGADVRSDKTEKMAGERTPLITTVRIGQVPRRYPHNTLRRFCTIALTSTLVCIVGTFLLTAVFVPHHARRHHHPKWSWPGWKGRKLSFEELKELLLDTPESQRAEEWSRYYASGAHLAGQNYSQAVWTRERWEEWGVKSEIVAYDVYLDRPVDHRLAILEKGEGGEGASSWQVAFEASLAEDALDEDPTTGFDTSIPTFHGYSASGNVTAPFVYVNYGTYQDYEDLVKANISLEGKIAIARYGGIFRGLKVKRAQELGIIGVVLYSDPGDDGETTEENGVDAYPKGPARQPSSVQRGSVQFLSTAPGDPTTPGYPSKPGVPRGPVDQYIPSIPSIPVSYKDALPILKALNGHGPKAKDFNKYWTRNVGLEYKGVEYNIGPTPDGLVLNLYNEEDYITTPIWDVIGVINGTVPDEVVIVGNHRDAWIVGGAGDPNSGSAVLNEVIRSFGKALEQGWKPLRTVVFASWDGEEYGLLGSTEWVEEFLPWLSHANVAYLNLDSGVTGDVFEAAAAPLLNKLIYDVTAAVQSPNQTVKGQTIRDTWDGKIGTMGSGSDFTPFQDIAGVPSLHVEFGGDSNAVYHYHSNYDSFWWMQHYGDPGFVYHRTMAQVFGLLTAELADKPVLALQATDYAVELDKYLEKIESKLDSALSSSTEEPESEEDIVALRASPKRGDLAATGDAGSLRLDLGRLHDAIAEFKGHAVKLDGRADELEAKVQESIPWWRWGKKLWLGLAIRKVNTKYKYIERAFIYPGGLDGRETFKHVVFAPGLWTGYAGAVFPGLQESIDANDYGNAVRWVGIIEDSIKRATAGIKLEHGYHHHQTSRVGKP